MPGADVPELPPHPTTEVHSTTASSESRELQRRRRSGMQKKTAIAKEAPPAAPKNLWSALLGFGCRRAAVVAAVELTVSVVVAAVEAATVTLDGIAQVGGSLGLAILVVTAQVRLTEAAKPPDGVTVMVAVFPDAAPGAMVRLPLFVSAKLGLAGAVTVTFTLVLAEIFPVAASVPVMVIA